MSIKRLLILAMVPVVAAVMFLVVRSRPESPAPLPLVIARVPAPISGLVDIAAAKGFFAAEGLAVTLQSANHGPDAIDAVLRGAADVGTSAETPIAFALVAGKRLRVIASIFNGGDEPGFVVRKDRGIAHPADLRGRRIAVVPGTVSQYLVDIMLAFYRIPRAAVTLVETKPDELAAALDSGAVDAGAIWNPHFQQALARLGDRAGVLSSRHLYALDFGLVVRPETLEQKRPAIDRLLRALLDAEAFARSHRDEAIDIVAAASGSDAQFLRTRWDDLSHEVSLSQALLTSIENEARWIVRRGLLPGGTTPDVLGAVADAPLLAVDPSRVGFSR